MPWLILGLGNPGDRYRDTRHNLGFRVVAEFARRRGLEFTRRECETLLAEDAFCVLGMPQTYMNRSGYAARCLVESRGWLPEKVLVVYDEVHLPLGKLRIRPSGSPAGHRGLESIVENLRTEKIARLRVGCGGAAGPPPGEGLADFVLAPFAPEEIALAETSVQRAAEACAALLAEGLEFAMSRFNG
ncbi:MAG: aminoacyl-tRNA hydrolase [Thermoanaerobaculia bacterium]|nr:aminoacyl-tRNA hydrolase [Thermoanaerobaculia bacterium]